MANIEFEPTFGDVTSTIDIYRSRQGSSVLYRKVLSGLLVIEEPTAMEHGLLMIGIEAASRLGTAHELYDSVIKFEDEKNKQDLLVAGIGLTTTASVIQEGKLALGRKNRLAQGVNLAPRRVSSFHYNMLATADILLRGDSVPNFRNSRIRRQGAGRARDISDLILHTITSEADFQPITEADVRQKLAES